MLKIRMQGTKKDLHWFRRLLERQGDVDPLPSPTAATTASCGFSFALSGRIMPDCVFSSVS